MTTPTPERARLTDPDEVPTERELVRERLQGKRKFWTDVVAYALINGFLVSAWAMGNRGYFWPGWVLAAWGVLLLIDAYRVFFSAPITESDIDEELRRRHQHG